MKCLSEAKQCGLLVRKMEEIKKGHPIRCNGTSPRNIKVKIWREYLSDINT